MATRKPARHEGRPPTARRPASGQPPGPCWQQATTARGQARAPDRLPCGGADLARPFEEPQGPVEARRPCVVSSPISCLSLAYGTWPASGRANEPRPREQGEASARQPTARRRLRAWTDQPSARPAGDAADRVRPRRSTRVQLAHCPDQLQAEQLPSTEHPEGLESDLTYANTSQAKAGVDGRHAPAVGDQAGVEQGSRG